MIYGRVAKFRGQKGQNRSGHYFSVGHLSCVALTRIRAEFLHAEFPDPVIGNISQDGWTTHFRWVKQVIRQIYRGYLVHLVLGQQASTMDRMRERAR